LQALGVLKNRRPRPFENDALEPKPPGRRPVATRLIARAAGFFAIRYFTDVANRCAMLE
jgi:hypothetical protein